MEELFNQLTHWSWWIIAVVLVVVEVAAPGTFFLWMGVSAGVVGLFLFLSPEAPWELQLALFATLSLVSIFLSKRYLQNNKEDGSVLSQRGKRYIGTVVVVEEAIVNGMGKVRIEDTVWRAHGEDVAEGNRVKVTGVDGATLQVESVDQ